MKTITITKKNLYDDIDSLTYKYSEVSSVATPEAKNGMQSDYSTDLDGHILARGVEYRDAQLRNLIQFAIAESELPVEESNDTLDEGTTFVYNLNVGVLKDSLLKMLATYIHRYLVYGALFDWYGPGMGDRQAGIYSRELENLEADIINIVRSQPFVKKPSQPFGRPVMPFGMKR